MEDKGGREDEKRRKNPRKMDKKDDMKKHGR
jgi:hypothetical protein